MKRNSYIYIDHCPVCDQGTIVAFKSVDSGQYLLMCDDCQAQWLEPDKLKNGGFTALSSSQELRGIIPISREELVEIGWDKYIAKIFK